MVFSLGLFFVAFNTVFNTIFFFLPLVFIYGDHAYTVRYVEDVPMLVIGSLYNYYIQYNAFGLFSAAVSGILLLKSTYGLITDILNDNERKKKETPQPSLSDLYGKLTFFEYFYLTCITPFFMTIYMSFFVFFYFIRTIFGCFLCLPKCHFCLIGNHCQAGSTSTSTNTSERDTVGVELRKEDVSRSNVSSAPSVVPAGPI